jgi:hypothetical protein
MTAGTFLLWQVGGELTSGSALGKGLVRLYDVNTTEILATWEEPKPVWACRLSPNMQVRVEIAFYL